MREQHALGIETVQVTSSKHAHGGASEQVDGLQFYRTARSRLASFPVLDQYDVIHGLGARLRQVLTSNKFDLVHAHSPCLTGIAALRASRAFRLPFVYEVRAFWEDAAVDHGSLRPNGPRYRAQRVLETWVLRRAHAVVCICEGLQREIRGRGVRAEYVSVVPNAVDLHRFSPIGHRDAELAQRLGLASGPVIGFIGSLYRYEGVDLLLEAMTRLRHTWPALRLLIVGGGPEEIRLKAKIRDLRLQDCIFATGPVPHQDIARYYSLLDLLIYPRRRTRLTEMVTPLKPLEAMAQGKPVLASDIGGHRELIRHGENGLLFRPEDPEATASAIDRTLASPAALTAITAAARHYVEGERSWNRSVARYPGIYASAIARYSGSMQCDRVTAPQG